MNFFDDYDTEEETKEVNGFEGGIIVLLICLLVSKTRMIEFLPDNVIKF